jgi:hypothetical protein
VRKRDLKNLLIASERKLEHMRHEYQEQNDHAAKVLHQMQLELDQEKALEHQRHMADIKRREFVVASREPETVRDIYLSIYIYK